MKNFYLIRIILSISLFATFGYSFAESPSQRISAHILRFEKDSIPVSNTFKEELKKLEGWTQSHNLNAEGLEYFEYLHQYLSYLKPNTYRKYLANMHDEVILMAIPILQAANQEDVDMKQFVFSMLPENYPAVKMLIPADVAYKGVMHMAKERPQELIVQFSWLDYSNDNRDILQAMLVSPHLFSQYMHYNNKVKSVMSESKDSNIRLLFDIYARYKFSNNAYYLLPYISNQSINIEQAEEIAKSEHLLLNYLMPLVSDTQLLASVSVKQKWDELAGKYLKKVKNYKSSPVQQWKMESLESASDTSRIMMLFLTQNTLNSMELDAFMQWISLRNFLQPIPANTLDKLPLTNIMQLKSRVEEQNLHKSWGQLWGTDSLKTYIQKRREQLSPQQLNLLQNQLAQPKGINIPLPQKLKEQPEFIIQAYLFNLPDSEKAFIKWKNDPENALGKIKDWINESYAGRLSQELALSNPLDLLQHLEDIKLKPYGIEALKTVAKTAPLSTKNYIIQPQHPFNQLFKTSVDSVMKTLYKIDKIAGINTRAYLLLDDIYKGKISIADADSLCKQPKKLVARLIEIASNPEALGRYSIEQELSVKALRFVRNLNISENTDQYFNEQLNSLSSAELYSFMTYGEDEIIESSFKKMLNHLLMSLPEGNVYPLMERMGFNQYDKFLRKCAFYGISDKIYSRMSEQQRERLVKRMLLELENSSEEDAILIADLLINLDYKPMTELMHQQLKVEYERCEKNRKDKGVAIYGVLSSVLSLKVDKGWAKYVAEKYELPALEMLPAYSLFNQQMVNVQQYFFYNDEDGISSFNNFIRSYERSSLEWEIKDKGSFVIVRSISGRKVEIYANKANDGEIGIIAMNEYMKLNKLEPLVVVHRGLSTHTLKTFTRLPESARLILDGSCGGYHVQQVAIQRAPGAQILCNRNIGTMYINDPIFKQISDDIRNGKDLIWPEFWNKMDSKLGDNPYFKDYIPPHKNAATILLKALYDVLEIH